MDYLVDGFNFIGAAPDMDLDNPTKASRLVSRLRLYATAKNHHIVVVFDGGKGGRWFTNKHLIGIWSGPEMIADDVIKARLELAPMNALSLVTDDRELQEFAHWCRQRIVPSLEFYHKIARWEKNLKCPTQNT